MTLATTINKADVLLKEAAEFHAQENQDSCLGAMLDLRDLLNEPIDVDTPKRDNTSENCKLCGKPKIA